MKTYLKPAVILIAAGLSLAACDKSPADKAADVSRAQTEGAAAKVDAAATATEQQGEAVGGATEDAMTAKADAMHNSADAIENAGEKKADAIEEGKMSTSTVDMPVTK
jgi:hypothetical protein